MEDKRLERAIEKLKECYVGVKDGIHTLDKSKIDGLSFMCSIHYVDEAIKCGIIDSEQFTKLIIGE